jgi:predicted P-loop ATPase
MNNNFADLQDELDGWRRQLILTPTKQPRPLIANAITALRLAPEWNRVVGHDEFALCPMLLKPPPWLKGRDNGWTPQRWTDYDDILLTNWLHHEGIGISDRAAASAANAVAKENTFHPVREYLNGLRWDGVKRIEQFAETYLGAAPTEYHRSVSRCMFIAAVARIMVPGCKHDHMPILEGEQDKGKSTAISLLFSPWFTDDLADLGTKDAAMQVRGAWGVEVAELAAMTRSEIERVKAFITRRTDRFRPPYGRHIIEVPRQSVFVGSTNADTYLKDETGGRRFWPIRCGAINLKAIERDKDQLWAEAVSLFNANVPWWLTGAEDIRRAQEEQADRYQEDEWQTSIANYLDDRSDTSISEIFLEALQMPEKSKWGQSEQNRVARCLRHLGWERYRSKGKKRPWRYRYRSVPL